jgi:hypothetical protein
MSMIAYNRLRGRGLYLEVRDIIKGADKPLSNIDVRDILTERYKEQLQDTPEQLYARVRRATEQLHLDGHLHRKTELGRTKADVYHYTHKPPQE